MKLEIGHATDVGRVREGNEDAFLVDERMGLVALADGMGGHRAGEVASATALEALRANVASGVPIREAITTANAAVYAKASTDETLNGMGTTVTAGTVAAGDTLVVGHVGDSRAYLLRDGELRRITEDHSLVEELVRGGRLTTEQAAIHPQRSIITRAVGIDPTVDVDVYPIRLRVGDRVVLCSDGLTDMVRDDDLGGVLRRERDPRRAAAQLVADALSAGGEDNVTVIVVDAREGDSLVEHPAAMPVGEVLVAEDVAEDVAVDVADDESAPGAEPSRPEKRQRRRWRATRPVLRIVLWALPILVIVGLGVGAAGWYARNAYYVTLTDNRVVMYKGRPGGVFGWDPTVERVTDLRRRDLNGSQREALSGEVEFSSKSDAEGFVDRLEETSRERRSTTTTTTTVAPAPAGGVA